MFSVPAKNYLLLQKKSVSFHSCLFCGLINLFFNLLIFPYAILTSFECNYVKTTFDLEGMVFLNIRKVLDTLQGDTDYLFSKHSIGRWTITKTSIWQIFLNG